MTRIREKEKTLSAINTQNYAVIGSIKKELEYIILLLRNDSTFLILSKFLLYRMSLLWKFIYKNKEYNDLKQTRELFYNEAKKRDFSAEGFDSHINDWVRILTPLKERCESPTICEIGSYEGRATLFLLLFFPNSKITVIDQWVNYNERANEEMPLAEERFDKNMAQFRSRIEKVKDRSASALAHLRAGGPEQFDLIYVDGSHFADDVLVDAILAWQLLKKDGILIFDDYLWRHRSYGPKKNPSKAINLFLRLIANDHDVLLISHQVAVKKSSSANRYQNY